MQKWEYRNLRLNDLDIEVNLKAYGEAGWELVAVTTMFTSFYLFFKRPIKD